MRKLRDPATWSEVLAVLTALGYRKVSPDAAPDASPGAG